MLLLLRILIWNSSAWFTLRYSAYLIMLFNQRKLADIQTNQKQKHNWKFTQFFNFGIENFQGLIAINKHVIREKNQHDALQLESTFFLWISWSLALDSPVLQYIGPGQWSHCA